MANAYVFLSVILLKKMPASAPKQQEWAEASIPSEAMMHFPPVSDSPIFEKFSDSVENFLNFTFSRKISRFSSAKISEDFFQPSTTNFEFPPIPCFSTFPPVSRILLISPYFAKFAPSFRKIHLLFTYFVCISFPPYFDHDAFMHHPMHVLDAPENGVPSPKGHLFQ